MMVTNNPSIPPIHPASKSAAGAQGNVNQARTQSSFDSFLQTTKLSEQDQLQKKLVSRISQEVRTAVTTGEIQALRGQIRNQTYELDPSGIAARILLMGEDV